MVLQTSRGIEALIGDMPASIYGNYYLHSSRYCTYSNLPTKMLYYPLWQTFFILRKAKKRNQEDVHEFFIFLFQKINEKLEQTT